MARLYNNTLQDVLLIRQQRWFEIKWANYYLFGGLKTGFLPEEDR